MLRDRNFRPEGMREQSLTPSFFNIFYYLHPYVSVILWKKAKCQKKKKKKKGLSKSQLVFC
jgi:hypothetical protein